jgi:hypothetical protein
VGIRGVIQQYEQVSRLLIPEYHHQLHVPIFLDYKKGECVKVVGEAQDSVMCVQLERSFDRFYWSVSKPGILSGIANKFVSKA